jgi:hypothetical protein
MGEPFVLELYHERKSQVALAALVREAHLRLVAALAPHLALDIRVLVATRIVRSAGIINGQRYDVPNQPPTSPKYQSLLITGEEIGYLGLAGPGQGCLSEAGLRAKLEAGGDLADISVHEWLHTLDGSCIGDRRIPSPDSNGLHERFTEPSGRGADGDATWHDWYRYILRP